MDWFARFQNETILRRSANSVKAHTEEQIPVRAIGRGKFHRGVTCPIEADHVPISAKLCQEYSDVITQTPVPACLTIFLAV
jgi:hypothetical protein